MGYGVGVILLSLLTLLHTAQGQGTLVTHS
jgi:hypothetical protein